MRDEERKRFGESCDFLVFSVQFTFGKLHIVVNSCNEHNSHTASPHVKGLGTTTHNNSSTRKATSPPTANYTSNCYYDRSSYSSALSSATSFVSVLASV